MSLAATTPLVTFVEATGSAEQAAPQDKLSASRAQEQVSGACRLSDPGTCHYR